MTYVVIKFAIISEKKRRGAVAPASWGFAYSVHIIIMLLFLGPVGLSGVVAIHNCLALCVNLHHTSPTKIDKSYLMDQNKHHVYRCRNRK